MKTDRHAQAGFGATPWTVVLQAASQGSDPNGDAFARLYTDYWSPLYAYARRRGLSRAEAEDLIQDFFVRLMEKKALSDVERDGGRFRSFLLKSLDNFLANQWDREQAQKRGGGQRALSLNADNLEARLALETTNGETPESVFERSWVFTLLEHVAERLRAEYASVGKEGLFQQLRGYLQGDRSGPSYAFIAEQLGMTEGAVKVAVHRMRHFYARLLREEIGRTVAGAAEIDEELRSLLRVVSES